MPGRCLLLLAMILLAACASTPPAPVIARTAPSTVVEPDRSALAATPADALVSSPVAVPVAETAGAGFYTVKKGDTLYSIALAPWSTLTAEEAHELVVEYGPTCQKAVATIQKPSVVH